ncbi:MAG: ornithine cyclodeaminase family protein, partial [Geminicoccaceae bacterium]
MTLTILTEDELRRCVELDAEIIDAIAGAFTALAAGRVVMPPVLHMDLAEVHGEVDVKTAFMPGLPGFAI